MVNKYDFSGWATKANLLCSDGRIIRKDAFKHHDGETVPLVWNHQHNGPEEILGHALLENRDDGVYAYCSFNDTEAAKTAKLCVQHGDINALSIYANRLKQQGPNVIHGMIREVSLVLAGANPGASIDSIMMHGEDSGEEGYIYTGELFDFVKPLTHADKEEKGETEVAEETKKTEAENSEETIKDVFETLSEKQKKAVYAMIGQIKEDKEIKHADEEPAEVEEVVEEVVEEEVPESEEDEELEHADNETIQDVFNTLTEKQQKVVYFMMGQLLEDKENNIEHSEGGTNEMKTNVFEGKETQVQENVLSHSDIKAIFAEAQRCGSLKDAVENAVLAHGIDDIELLFPDHKNLNGEPEFIKRDDEWVAKVLGGVHHTPFTRIKTLFADITKAEARAKGYTKGNLKVEEVFKLLKRTTNPTTVYKKQKLDRDDMLDITDFNVIPWLKKEIRMMLNEEIARAILIGDGRDPVEEANDKIDEECIRPIWKMEELFTVKYPVNVEASATEEDKAKAFIKACIKSRKQYKGSGNPVMFMSEDMLTDCMLIEDVNGRRIYDDENKLRAALRVSEIIPVPVMEGDAIKRTDDNGTFELAGLYVNLKDYNVGTDKGGEINMFDDFDLDYNQYKYLMETRCSGALVKPHSAVAIEFKLA